MSTPGTAKGKTVLLPLEKNQEFRHSFLFLPLHCPRHPLKASAAQLTRYHHWQPSDSVLILKSRLEEIVPLEQIRHHYSNGKMTVLEEYEQTANESTLHLFKSITGKLILQEMCGHHKLVISVKFCIHEQTLLSRNQWYTRISKHCGLRGFKEMDCKNFETFDIDTIYSVSQENILYTLFLGMQ